MIPHQALILWRMLAAAYGTFRPYAARRGSSAVGGRADMSRPFTAATDLAKL
jgi:hypothetical protein